MTSRKAKSKRKYTIEKVEDMHWFFAWQKVETYIIRSRGKEPSIIYVWVKDCYNVAFKQIRHFLDYMGGGILDKAEELERFDLEDIFDYESNGNEDPFGDFLISIVENKYDKWLETAYDGKYILQKN